MKNYEITPLFRLDKGQQVIYLVPRRPDPKPARVSINIILFVLTVLSVLFVGAQPTGQMPTDTLGQILFFVKAMLSGWPYALSLMSILLAHEFGHYLMSRYHKTPATLPYFIPLPVPPLGTMGAAILMQGTPKNKRVLFDIGVAGPLAGIIVAIPDIVLWTFTFTSRRGETGGWHGGNGGEFPSLFAGKISDFWKAPACTRQPGGCHSFFVLA